jgi:uncharacterized phage protein (TIGR01671 family)
MNREILFRAWVPKEKTMIEHREVMERAHKIFKDSLNDSDIVMQYTGIKDKNGKKIFEGDIVTYWFEKNIVNGRIVNERHSETKSVVFANGTFCFDETDEVVFGVWIWECEPEVVGNIYEK